MGQHALLSPSSASQWIACPPSVWYQLNFPDDDESEFAAEGTLAHSLGELLIRYKLGQFTKQKYEVELKAIKAIGYYDAAMQGYCEEYAVFIIESYYALQAMDADAEIFIEERLRLSDWIPQAFGTSDCIMVGAGILHMPDLKFGKGVKVDAEDNKQLKIYALGAYSKYGLFSEIHTIRLTIYQPRLDNISTWEISIIDLLDWANTILKPSAEKVFRGEGEFVAGKHCQFCKGKSVCRISANFNMQALKYDFSAANTLQDDEISKILNLASSLKSWVKSVEEFAIKQALAGKRYPGYKLVEGRGNRKYIDEMAIIKVLIAAGYKKDAIVKTGLISLTELEKLVPKTDIVKHLSGLILKPSGAPTLVTLDDKRIELRSKESAAVKFEGDFIDADDIFN